MLGHSHHMHSIEAHRSCFGLLDSGFMFCSVRGIHAIRPGSLWCRACGDIRQVPSTKRLRQPTAGDEAASNRVHELLALLKSSFEDKKGARHWDYLEAADVAKAIIERIGTDGSILRTRRSRVLRQVYEVAAAAYDASLSAVPSVAPALWKQRDERRMSPVDFVLTHYAEAYVAGLTLTDIRSLDEPLYRALYNHRQNHGWPKTFSLRTRSATYDELLKPDNPVTLAGVNELSNAERKARRRLYSAQRKRAS